jgi:hypothetical protein
VSEEQHFLVVEAFDPDDDTDRFTIEHPARCATLDMPCHVGHYEEDGIGSYFRHADDVDAFADWLPAVPVGRHAIEGWTKKVGWEFTEYDGGLRLVEGAAS